MDNVSIIENKKFLMISLSGSNNKVLALNKSHITECEILGSNTNTSERYLKISLISGKEYKFLKSQMSFETMTKIMANICDDSE